MVVPWPSISAASRRRPARSSASVAARVAATVDLMPPAWYGRPAIRAANSADRSPANTRCACESTKPGSTARPATSAAASAAGARAAGPVHAITPVLDDQGGALERGEAAGRPHGAARGLPPSGALVTSSPIPVISRERAIGVAG